MEGTMNSGPGIDGFSTGVFLKVEHLTAFTLERSEMIKTLVLRVAK